MTPWQLSLLALVAIGATPSPALAADIRLLPVAVPVSALEALMGRFNTTADTTHNITPLSPT